MPLMTERYSARLKWVEVCDSDINGCRRDTCSRSGKGGNTANAISPTAQLVPILGIVLSGSMQFRFFANPSIACLGFRWGWRWRSASRTCNSASPSENSNCDEDHENNYDHRQPQRHFPFHFCKPPSPISRLTLSPQWEGQRVKPPLTSLHFNFARTKFQQRMTRRQMCSLGCSQRRWQFGCGCPFDLC